MDDEQNTPDPQTYAIIGACMAVHNELGPGFLESVYQEALAIEFTRRGIPFIVEKPIPIDYCGVRLITHFDADFLCYADIIVELKAVTSLASPHYAIIINYLKATYPVNGDCSSTSAPSASNTSDSFFRLIRANLRHLRTTPENCPQMTPRDADEERREFERKVYERKAITLTNRI